MNQNKPSGAPTVFSVISFVISVLAFICAVIFLLTSAFDPDGGTATAVSNRGILTLTGMIFFTAGVWIFGIIGSLLGFIMTIVDIVAKRTRILWMPITAVVLAIVSIVLSFKAY